MKMREAIIQQGAAKKNPSARISTLAMAKTMSGLLGLVSGRAPSNKTMATGQQNESIYRMRQAMQPSKCRFDSVPNCLARRYDCFMTTLSGRNKDSQKCGHSRGADNCGTSMHSSASHDRIDAFNYFCSTCNSNYPSLANALRD